MWVVAQCYGTQEHLTVTNAPRCPLHGRETLRTRILRDALARFCLVIGGNSEIFVHCFGALIGFRAVRDLYGVIHDCGAAFGIIISRGGFSKGAIDFARDKPILFLDTDDLIAMQEGRDVLAAAFKPTET